MDGDQFEEGQLIGQSSLKFVVFATLTHYFFPIVNSLQLLYHLLHYLYWTEINKMT